MKKDFGAFDVNFVLEQTKTNISRSMHSKGFIDYVPNIAPIHNHMLFRFSIYFDAYYSQLSRKYHNEQIRSL